MGKPEMTELEIPRELLSFPRDCKSLIDVADATVDELFAEIKLLNEVCSDALSLRDHFNLTLGFCAETKVC